MFGQTILLLCVTAFAHSASLPNIDEILSKLNFSSIDLSSDRENQIDSNANVCETEICAKDSARILGYIDQSVDPCDNFYEFACGKYMRNTVLSQNQIIDSAFAKLTEKVGQQMIAALSEEMQPNEPRAFQLTKHFTKMCMNQAARDAHGVNPLMEILEKFGGWPVIKGEKWNENHWNWLDAHKQMFDDGLNSDVMVEFSIAPHYHNSTKRVIYIDRPNFGLPDEYLLAGMKHPHTAAYFFFMIISATIFGAKPAKAQKELQDALQFETQLAKISLRLHERQSSVITNEFNIKTLQATFPYMDWREYINWNMNNAVHVDEDEVIFVPDVNYFHQLNKLIKKTPKRTVANYFAWRSVLFSGSLLNNRLLARSLQYDAATTGKLIVNSRLAECVRQTLQYFPISGSAAYVRKYFDMSSKKAVESLTYDIQDAFLEKLEKISWMDESTRHEAIRKAEAMIINIGYPDELIDDEVLDEYYRDLELNENVSLFHNVLRIRKFEHMYEIKQFREPIDRNDWRDHATRAAMVNAFNIPSHNTIQIPAAILQGRMYSAKRPSYMTYGTIGWIIGHEITHGFDNSGRQLDLNGNLVNWWQKDTLNEFNKRAQCFVNKYSSYKHPTLNLVVNGARTLGENIADVGGVKAAYAAYQRFVQQNGPEPSLPGLNYTPNQMFWISGAHLWCSIIKPQYTKVLYGDVHSPDNFRVLGAFSSAKEFAKDFKCARNTPMNPVKKCEIW